jgi:RNA-directed DNA polymerase
MHYAFDLWMTQTHPYLPWCRYADDGLAHCRNEQQAEALEAELGAPLAACGLQMHPTKTKIVYCRDQRRRGEYPNVVFDFLGYQFRLREGCRSDCPGADEPRSHKFREVPAEAAMPFACKASL